MNSKAALMLNGIFVFGCVQRSHNDSYTLSAIKLHPLEQPFPDEEELTRKAVEQALGFVRENLKKHSPSVRDPHSKGFGCLRASFKVDHGLGTNTPQKYKVGIFSENKTFPAWIRFSSANPGVPGPDNRPTGLGMAIKLMNVPGEKVLLQEKNAKTQDFLLVNHPVFLVRNIKDYLEGQPNPVAFGLKHPRTGKILFDVLSKKNVNPISFQYWSMTAFSMGTEAVKFTARPVSCGSDPFDSPNRHDLSQEGKDENYLTENLTLHFKHNPKCYWFLLQEFENPESTPIEDPSVEWKSQMYPVAKITIPSQEFNSPKQKEFCENLSFTPWHTLPEHRPLGNLNRVRLATYEAVSKQRHLNNNVRREEPTGEEEFN